MYAIALAIVAAALPVHILVIIAMCWIRRKYNRIETVLVSREAVNITPKEMVVEYNRMITALHTGPRPPILMTERDKDIEERFKRLVTDVAAMRRARILNAALVTASSLMRSNDTRRLITTPLSQKIGVNDLSANPIVAWVFDMITTMLASYECVEPNLSAPHDQES